MSLDTSEREPLTYTRALRQAGSGATSLATGTGGLGYLLGKQGVALLGAGVSKARAGIAARSGAAKEAAVEVAAPATSSGRTRLVVGGAALALLAAGAAFFSISKRRKAAPPVAEAPPSLSPSVNGSAPATPVAEQSPAAP